MIHYATRINLLCFLTRSAASVGLKPWLDVTCFAGRFNRVRHAKLYRPE